MVDGSVSSAAAGPLSVRAYARHRGVSAPAVLKAIDSGRLKACLVNVDGKAKIADVALADQEWTAKTDLSRAPGYVKARAADTRPVVPAAAESSPRAPGLPSSGLATDAPPSTAPLPAVGAGLSLAEASAIEKEWRARLAEQEYKKRSGDLIDGRDAERKWADIVTRSRTKLLGLPSKAKTALPHLSRADLLTLDHLVREALEELADDSAA